ncbi:MAG: hypothetical protein ACTSWZ_00550 [Candidatus Heimdallarchaeaceae archaeon]
MKLLITLMMFNNIDKNANILRIIIDNSLQDNFALVSSLSRILSDIFDDQSCKAKLGEVINIKKGIEAIINKKVINNLDIAYLIILAGRGYSLREDRNSFYLCDDTAITPIFEKLTPIKPKLSRNDKIKSAVLLTLLDSIEKDDDYILRTLIRTVPEFIERVKGVSYLGRFLSINEWIKIKEEEPDAIWEETEDGGMLKLKNETLVHWVFANLLILQMRGYYLQEVPALSGNSYTFVKKEHP